MKILAVDHTAVYRTNRELYRLLNGQFNIEILLLTPSKWIEFNKTFQAETEDPGLAVYFDNSIFYGKAHRLLYTSLAKHLRQFKPDILLLNTEPENYLSLEAFLLQKYFSNNTKIILTTWRNIDYRYKKYPYKFSFLHKLCEEFVKKKITHYIAFTETAKNFMEQIGLNNITVIPPYVNTKIFFKSNQTHLRSALGLNGYVIGFVGRFVKEKGVDCLLRSVSQLKYNYQILLVGNGPCKEQWFALAKKLGIYDKIIWIKAVEHSQIQKYLNTMDVLVLPSITTPTWKEQFGRVLIEAMACEVPVIGSNSGEIPNVIGESGLIFQEGNYLDLKEKLEFLYENQAFRDEITQKSLVTVKTKYDISKVAMLYLNLFSSILKKKN